MRFPSDVKGTTNFTGDYNRPETDNTEWREQLIKHASEYKIYFVFEVHSFPGDHPMYKKLWPDADLVVFKSKWNAHFIDQLVKNIKTHNPFHKNIQIREPWHPVSITDDMGPHPNVMGHALIEFNEAMSLNDRSVMSAAVVNAVLDLNIASMLTTYTYKKIMFNICIATLVITLIFIVLAYSSSRLQYHLQAYMYPLAYHPRMQ
jgi:hypothetical protein